MTLLPAELSKGAISSFQFGQKNKSISAVELNSDKGLGFVRSSPVASVASSKTLNFIEDTKKSRRNMACFPLHCLQDDESEHALCTTYVPVDFTFHNAIIFSYRLVRCADHIYDNSTLMETDLSLLRVFWVRLRFCGIVSTLARAHPQSREKTQFYLVSLWGTSLW